MDVSLFAGMPVSDLERSLAWYEQLLGAPPSFLPNRSEAVWELAEHRFVYVVMRPDGRGGGVATVFVSDLDAWEREARHRGLEPAERETYENGVRKLIYRDPDGNEFGVGGGPPA